MDFICAVRVPGGVNCRGNVHGHRIRSRSHGKIMKKETLDALLNAMKEYLPKFHEYLKAKAKALGIKGSLPWYDMFAPLGSIEKKYTVDEAKEYLINIFSTFDKDLTDMVRTAFEEDWIDFFPREGKVGGAFCAGLEAHKQSRVLANFDGSFNDIVTLAHELGHAYHGKQIEDHRPLNTGYTMPVAETASNFNELIIVNDAISKAEGGEKISLIESQIQDCTQIIVDIYSRFLFEDEVIRRRKNKFMFADELEAIMLDAQKQAYGDGLDPDFHFGIFWGDYPTHDRFWHSTGATKYNWNAGVRGMKNQITRIGSGTPYSCIYVYPLSEDN